MIDVRNVSKVFKDSIAVDQINFKVNEGEIFGFLGPNGAGKTTTIRMMIGLLKPSKGEIWIDQLNIQSNTKKVHERIGVVFELPNLYLKWSIRDNLVFFADLYKVPLKQVENIMESLHLDNKAEQKVHSLSKGWKQRVLIARALLHQPKILFLDEPTSGLDPNTATLIRKYIHSLKLQGTTIVLTTHDMNEADQLSDRVGIMYQGKLVALDSPQKIKERYGKDEVVVEYKENNDLVKVILPLNTPETAAFLYEKMYAGSIINLHSQEATLADVFARLTGSELS
ncbi:ABC transporter ATP-binding protein [Mesobacillus harenae]|uniref:ABC transporter ATP-binding protein n=1 Tax=Mesobacillus harenae TaxID=2213203 RepID=UPI001580DA8E|nr:ABC transporter ATP-binding protein [Mesobacillus harenae]